MGIKKNIVWCALIALSSLTIAAADTSRSAAASSIKKYGRYLFSAKGAKDLAVAYVLSMGLTAVHEAGHAVTAKALFAHPLHIVLGASSGQPNHPTYCAVSGVSLGGLNPILGYSCIPLQGDKPLQNAMVCAGGPVCGLLGSVTALCLLRKYNGLYVTKSAAAFGLLDHTGGPSGIGGAWIPGADAHNCLQSLSMYKQNK